MANREILDDNEVIILQTKADKNVTAKDDFRCRMYLSSLNCTKLINGGRSVKSFSYEGAWGFKESQEIL